MRLPWKPGPPQMFLNDQEHAFYSTMIDSIRGTGSPPLVAAGNMWGDNPLSSLPSLMTGDVIDVHEYDGPGLLTTDARYKPNIVSMIGINQVWGKPLTVSEWNLEMGLEPTVDRFIAPMYVASIAALQGWDALMLYGYSQQRRRTKSPVPVVGLLQRSGHLGRDARRRTLVSQRTRRAGQEGILPGAIAGRDVQPDDSFRQLCSGPHADGAEPIYVGDPGGAGARLAAPGAKLPAGTYVIHHPDESFLPADATQRVTSDTGELKRDWEAGIQTIDTPKTQAAQGAIGENKIQLSDVTVLVGTRHATVAVSSPD